MSTCDLLAIIAQSGTPQDLVTEWRSPTVEYDYQEFLPGQGPFDSASNLLVPGGVAVFPFLEEEGRSDYNALVGFGFSLPVGATVTLAEIDAFNWCDTGEDGKTIYEFICGVLPITGNPTQIAPPVEYLLPVNGGGDFRNVYQFPNTALFTSAAINNAFFGCAFRAKNNSELAASEDWQIRDVRIRVHYTA